MLKIKENVDLKELEKFGFYWDDELECYKYKILPYPVNNFEKYQEIIVDVFDKKIKVEGFSFNTNELIEVDDYILDTLYVLIKEGLVEEVVEE